MRLGRGLRGLGVNVGIGAGTGAVAGGATALADDRDFLSGVMRGTLAGAGAGAGYTGLSRARNIAGRKSLISARKGLRQDYGTAQKLYGSYGVGTQGGLAGWSGRRAMNKYTAGVASQRSEMRMMGGLLRGQKPSRFVTGMAGAGLGAGMAYATLPSNLSVGYRDATLRERLQYDAAKAAMWRSKMR